MTISRSLLAAAFPDNPRMVAEMEALDALIGETTTRAQQLQDQIEALAALLDANEFQPKAALLDALAELPNRVGAIEITGLNEATIRPIDGGDPASLLSRNTAYTVLVGQAGKGVTADRPVLPADVVGIYFDTTLATAGKPVFWTGTAWIDATGAAA